MPYLRLFLVALVFVLQASASAAGSVQSCCGEMDCTLVQCAKMNCLAERSSQFPAVTTALPIIALPDSPSTELACYLPLQIKEVSCPPD